MEENYIRPEPNTENYRKQMDDIIASGSDLRPRLMLHACCAPCSSAVLETLSASFDITLFFYNPNISTKCEYDKRAAELVRFTAEFGLDIPVEIADYDHSRFLELARGHEKDPERGERCHLCYRERLQKTAEAAVKAGNFDFFCTTLTLSPLKSAEILNRTGREVGEMYGIRFLPSDFKKKGGYQRSIVLSQEYKLYRQDFCGCEFSRR